MALDLTGIENVEFYSGHYLDAVLEGDLKDLFKAWSDAEEQHGQKPPYKSLAPSAAAWEKARKAASGEPDRGARWRAARSFHAVLIEALGYAYAPEAAALDDGTLVPLLSSVVRDGRPYLWIVDAPFPASDAHEALDTPLFLEQYPQGTEGPELVVVPQTTDPDRAAERATWRELLDGVLFRQDPAPRWILLLAGDELILAERHKWTSGRLLRFDLAALLSRKESKALQAFCALVHRDALAPGDGGCLHDTLEEKSHKHAFAVSGDLKHGVRRAVELLGNEAVHYRREVQRRGVFDDPDLARKLKDDCLTYMYRLLFLLYVEARGAELGIVPMNSDAYREGYSIESLRDLELVPLTTEKARNGFYLDTTLKTLFRIVNEGFFEQADAKELFTSTEEEVMRVSALRAPLFDDERLEILGKVRFRNHVLQEVLRLLSLSSERRGKGRRGRISYAQLGINQLGAVYESLLSYTGIFANEDEGLYEVATKEDVEAIKKSYSGGGGSRADVAIHFVPGTDLERYHPDEFVVEPTDDGRWQRVKHPKGSFVYALAGRSREKSASYYTPEVLTRCVVKYALKELLYDDSGHPKRTAAEILDLTVCEPAMGSGAFLLEAIDQLADAYLQRRQEELGKVLPTDRYQAEKRRVKARLATNNCYGVDLNPTAVQLAQVSLWLGSMAEGGKCPWFGLRLAHGNSLIGARREVFRTSDVTRKGGAQSPNWLDRVPERVPMHYAPVDGAPVIPIDANWKLPPRPKETIYHFLLPATGMAAFDKDKVVKEYMPDAAQHITAWRKEFTQPFDKEDATRLERLSDAVDRLWSEVVRERHLAVTGTTDRVTVWGDPGAVLDELGNARDVQPEELRVQDQEQVARALEDSSSAFRRLRLVMDAWCALWFWPLEEAHLLPSRREWLSSLELLLLGEVHQSERGVQHQLFEPAVIQHELPIYDSAWRAVPPRFGRDAGQATAVAEVSPQEILASERERVRRLRALADAFTSERRQAANTCGVADVDQVVAASPWLRTAARVAGDQAFHHWELRFAELYGSQGGFDLMLGNPPWIKIQWMESGLLAEFDPSIALGGVSASEVLKRRAQLIAVDQGRSAYFGELVAMFAAQEFMNATQNEPLLRGMQTNLYKCFITRAWSNLSADGVVGLLHPEGAYDDPKGGSLRSHLYRRLRGHFQFVNEGLVFAGVDNHTRYSVNVSGAPRLKPKFLHCSNLIHPSTIDRSWDHDGHGEVPGIKSEDDRFETRGHRSRLIPINEETLALFASLYDEPGTEPLAARLPVVHSTELLEILRRLAAHPQRLGDFAGEYFATVMFDEAYAPRDGTIRRHTRFPSDPTEWIVQGPHFYVGTPFNKTPNEVCDTNRAYTAIDLTAIGEDYLPRTNYVPACDPDEYALRTPKWNGKPVTDFYRYINRRAISVTGERALIPSLIPPGPGHIDGVVSLVGEPDFLLTLLAVNSSIVIDFLIKSTGKADCRAGTLATLPLPARDAAVEAARERLLALCCIGSYLRPFSRLCTMTPYEADFASVLTDPRSAPLSPRSGDQSEVCPLLTDLDRRAALVEVDVLIARVLGLGLDDLLTIYRTEYGVLQQYERDQVYDQHGRVVPAAQTVRKLPVVSIVELGQTLARHCGFDLARAYPVGCPSTMDLLGRSIKLAKADAELLGVTSPCAVADLMKPTAVRYWDSPDGSPVSPEGRTVELMGLAYTDPGLEPRMERVYPTPWTRCDREEDYRVAWAEFERRLATHNASEPALDA